MDHFYLKIYGWYDKDIVKNINSCEFCPNNPSYRRYHDYNKLLNKKDNVLVLKSDFNDFCDYDVYCSYYSDKRTNSVSNVDVTNPSMNNITIVELYGTKKTIWNKIVGKVFNKDMIV